MKSTLLLILLLLLLTVPVYFLVYCIIALYHPFRRYPSSAVCHKIAVLIPARNEEHVIGNLVQSLMQQNYPKDAYEIDVLINHCTDGTESAAAEAGAKIIRCRDTSSKGEVLQYAFGILKEDPSIEAYIVMDSDNLADPDFLRRMNDAYSEGHSLAQGRRTGKNCFASWVSCCYEVFYVLQNIFFNHARSSTGRSASFNGTAWLMSRSYLLKYGYKTYTMTEDVELMALAALQNESIAYVHDALVYDEYPVTLKVSLRQLDRWIFGQMQCMRRYTGRLFHAVFAQRSKSSLDMGMILSMPVLALLAAMLLIFWLYSDAGAAAFCGKYLWAILLVLYIAMIWFLTAVLCKNQSSPKKLMRGILCFPLFILIWLVLMPVNLFRRKLIWKPIPHEFASKIEEMH